MDLMRDVRSGEAREVSATSLPWEWFDFAELPREPAPGVSATVEEGGAQRTWRVKVDHQMVPFKLLRKRGQGAAVRPMVVMMHGMGLTIATFHGVAGHLLQTHDLALIDYSSLSTVNWGTADGWPHGGVGLKVMAEAVWAVADAVGIEKVDLAGNSLGGALCLIATLQKPARVRRLVLANPACYPQHLPFMYRMARIPVLGELLMSITRAEKLIQGLEHIGYVDKQRFVGELRCRYLRVMGSRRNRIRLMEMIRHLPQGPRDMTVAAHVPRLGTIDQPVMLTWGDKDPLLAAGSGERLAQDLKRCEFLRYPDLAHMPHEEAPEVVGPEWARFLGESQ